MEKWIWAETDLRKGPWLCCMLKAEKLHLGPWVQVSDVCEQDAPGAAGLSCWCLEHGQVTQWAKGLLCCLFTSSVSAEHCWCSAVFPRECSELPASLCVSERNEPYIGDTPVLGLCLWHSGFAPPFAHEKAAGAAELEDLFVIKPDVLEREPEDRPAAPSAPGALPGSAARAAGAVQGSFQIPTKIAQDRFKLASICAATTVTSLNLSHIFKSIKKINRMWNPKFAVLQKQVLFIPNWFVSQLFPSEIPCVIDL